MPHTFEIAIVGDGAAALATLAVLQHAGAPPGSVAVLGDGRSPLANLERYAGAVRQSRMRSEGDGHLSPEGWPGLALIDSWRRRSPLPALAGVLHRYTPPLDLLVAHAREVAERYGFEQARVRARVGRLVRVERPRCAFALEDEDGAPLGEARHVVLALGHPGLRWPAAAAGWRYHPRVAHAYQSPEIHAGERVVVVGGGMAAAHVWLAALEAGAEVTALHRKPLTRQMLNAPRCMFSSVGIDAYRSLADEQRRARLAAVGGSFAPRWGWERQLARAGRAGQFREAHGEPERIEERPGPHPLTLWLHGGDALAADRVIFATGFRTEATGHPLVRRLVETYDVPTVDGMLRTSDDCTLPPLSRPESILAAVGALARWALPTADTFFGMKYAARRLAPQLLAGGRGAAP